MAVMAVLTLFFGGEPYVPACALGAGPARTEASAPMPPPPDARSAVNAPTQRSMAVPDVTLADAPAPSSDPPDLDDAVDELRRRRLDLPLATIDRATLRSNFDELRGGTRRHEAMDLLAPRHTPVLAVEAGIIARLFNSKAGGITIYQFDPTTTLRLLLCAPRALRRWPGGRGDGVARPGDGLCRHIGQRAGEHAAPALCDLRPGRRQALVAGHAGRPLHRAEIAAPLNPRDVHLVQGAMPGAVRDLLQGFRLLLRAPRVRRDCGADPGARHRRHHHALQRGQRRAGRPAAVSRLRQADPGVAERAAGAHLRIGILRPLPRLEGQPARRSPSSAPGHRAA